MDELLPVLVARLLDRSELVNIVETALDGIKVANAAAELHRDVDRGEDDLKRLQRIRKRSFWWYKDVIAQNGNHDESQR